MERVHLDFIGPLPKTLKGNEHILMMVDQFTKWVECIPLPSQTAEVTATAAINEFFSRFGYPFQIFTDQGRNFESSLFTNVCKLLQIHKSRTTPYRPSANGQVKRFNRTLMDSIRCFVGKTQNQWDKYLPQIAGAMRSTVNRSTGFTPTMLMLGREINLPSDLMFPIKERKTFNSTENYCVDLVSSLELAHEVARERLDGNQKRMKRDYDLKVRKYQFKQGDIVYMLDQAAIKGKCKKLLPPWKGPCQVIAVLSPYHYRVQYKKRILTVNHDRLKICESNDISITARTDKQELYCLCRKPDPQPDGG